MSVFVDAVLVGVILAIILLGVFGHAS